MLRRHRYTLLFTLLFTLSFSTVSAQLRADFTADTLEGCPPVIVNFKDLSEGNPTSWQWDLGNGTHSSIPNPATIYNKPGTYTVTLTVGDGIHSDKIVKQAYVTVSDTPNVDFLVSPSSGCYPLEVNFTDYSKAGTGATIKSWLWDFGDGNISHKTNPSHLYEDAGKFTVALSVTNSAGCIGGISQTGAVVTNEGVKAGFTANRTFSCIAPMTVHFSAQSGAVQPVTYQWHFGDGSTASGVAPTHTYTQTGVYSVILKASTVNGCTDTVVHKNLINVGSFHSDFQLPQGCAKVPLMFKNTSSPLPASAIWHFSDGAVIRKVDAVHKFSKPGTYTVMLVNIYGGGCKDSVTKTLTTFPTPNAVFNSSIQKYCNLPATVVFENLSQDAVSAKWDFGDGGASAKLQPEHTYIKNGFFDVKLTVKNEQGCVDSMVRPKYIQVNDPKTQFVAPVTSGCIPLTVNFQNKIKSVAPIASYFWDFGDGNTSSSANPSHTYSVEGTYDVKLKIITSSGCVDSLVRKKFVRTGRIPTVDFTATPKSVCIETPIQFTNLSKPKGNSWIWSFPDDGQTTDSVENPLHRFYHIGKQDVILTVNNNGCLKSLTKPDFVTIKAPKAMMDVTQFCKSPYKVTFTDKSKSAVSWQWDFGDGTHFTGQNPPPHTYSNTGIYKVILVAKNDECVSGTSKKIHVIDLQPVLKVSSGIVCHGTLLHFAMEHTKDTSLIKSYTWVLGNGKSYTTKVPTAHLKYPKNGVYNAQLITTDLNGCKDTSSIVPITVRGPEADFILSPSTTCSGTKVTFKDNSTISGAPIQQWKWNFGDSTTATLSDNSVIHAYHSGGKYKVHLVVTDENGCTDEKTYANAVSVFTAEASFSTIDSLICPGAPINWMNKSKGNKLIYHWDFGDNTTGNKKIPSKTYMDEGVYTVSLTVETPLGCKDTVLKNDYIRVGAPQAKMSYADNNVSCPPFIVTVANLSKNYRKVEWDFGDGTTSNNTDTAKHIYTIPGNYRLKLLVYGYSNGCKDSIIRTVSVAGPSGSPLIIDSVGCSPHKVRFSATAVNTVSFRWDFGNGQISSPSSTDEASYIYKNAGVFQPLLILEDAHGCIVPIPVKHRITVDAVDKVPLFTIPEDCDSSLLQFQTQGQVFSEDSLHIPANYRWNFGEPGYPNNISTAQEPQHDYAKPGKYPVEVRIKTIYGCNFKDTLQVVVPKPFVMQITTSPDTAICSGMYAFLRANGASRYVWSPAKGLSNTESATPIAIPNATTLYKVIGYSKSDCQSDTANIRVVVNDHPIIHLLSDTTIGTGSSIRLPVSYSPDAITWSWTPLQYLNCTHCATPVSTPHKPMNYRVVATNQWGCTDTASIKVNLVCKQGKVFIPNTFTPNNDGMNDIFYPRGKGVREVIYFHIFNRWGQLMYEREHFQLNDRSAGWNGTFKGQKLKPGVFIYQTFMRCESGEVFKLNGNITLLR